MQAYFFIQIMPKVVPSFLYYHVFMSAWYTEMQITSRTLVPRSTGPCAVVLLSLDESIHHMAFGDPANCGSEACDSPRTNEKGSRIC